MAEREPAERDNRNERVAIPLDPEDALRALLNVDPASEPVEEPKPQEEPPDPRRR